MTTITEQHERPRMVKVAVAWDTLMRFMEVVDAMDRLGLRNLGMNLEELEKESSDKQEKDLIRAAIKYIEYVKTVNK